MSNDLENNLRASMRRCADDVRAGDDYIDTILANARSQRAPRWRPAALLATRRRRLMVAAGCLLGVGLPGVAVATSPQSVEAVFPWLTAEHQDGGPFQGPIPVAALKRVATSAGPAGTRASVVIGRDGNQFCVFHILESDRSVTSSKPTDVKSGLGSYCRVRPTPELAFGRLDQTYGTKELGAIVWDANAGAAVRAEVRSTSTREVYPVLVADNHLFGWVPWPDDYTYDAPYDLSGYVLTGWDARNQVVGQGALDSFNPTDAQGRVVGPMENQDGSISDGSTVSGP